MAPRSWTSPTIARSSPTDRRLLAFEFAELARGGFPLGSECLELLGCAGAGKVNKLAEIIAATVLCGELSLGSAVVAEEWVKAHDIYGRNR